MKVICIDAESRPDCPPCDLVEGDTYTVIDIYHFSMNSFGDVKPHTVYVLAERDNNFGYGAERFIKTSDLDETTLVNEEWEEKVCVPVNGKL
jgi:hypothetical protein